MAMAWRPVRLEAANNHLLLWFRIQVRSDCAGIYVSNVLIGAGT